MSWLSAGCRYEGEFHSGFAHGVGMYTSHDGEVYRGEFLLGKRNGRAPRARPPFPIGRVSCAWRHMRTP